MFEYSCEFIMGVDRSDKFSPYTVVEKMGFNCENSELWDFIELEADFYFDHPEFDKLEDGDYFVYARGIAEFESDRDWESGIEEGHYLLGIDKLKIIPWKDEDDLRL